MDKEIIASDELQPVAGADASTPTALLLKRMDKALEQLGWSAASLEIDVPRQTLTLEVRRHDGRVAGLYVRPRTVTLERWQWGRAKDERVKGARYLCDRRVAGEFIGRTKFASFHEGLIGLANYVADNSTTAGEATAVRSAVLRVVEVVARGLDQQFDRQELPGKSDMACAPVSCVAYIAHEEK
jgi:hypothetical protein